MSSCLVNEPVVVLSTRPQPAFRPLEYIDGRIANLNDQPFIAYFDICHQLLDHPRTWAPGGHLVATHDAVNESVL